MNIEHRVLQLERQNKLLKLSVFAIVMIGAAFSAIGASSFNPDRGELLNVTKIQLVDSKGNEVAVIDAKGVSYSSKDSLVVANTIIGRRRVEANSNPENDQRYAELGTTSDKKCYLELNNKGATYHNILSDSGALDSNF